MMVQSFPFYSFQRYRFVLFLSGLFLLSACSTSLSPRNLQYDHFYSALQPSYLNEPVEDINALKDAHLAKPDDIKAARLYAYGLYDTGNYTDAVIVFNPFITAENTEGLSADDYYFYATALIEIDNITDAKDWLKKAIALDNKHISARLLLADLLENTQDEEAIIEAEALYSQAIEGGLIDELSQDKATQFKLSHALNLAQQKKFREANEILYGLQESGVTTKEVERNLRIMRAMMQSNGHSAPKPVLRPVLKPAQDKK